MSNSLTYKGFSARIGFDAEDRIFVGRVADICDVVGFHSETVAGLDRAFHEAINDYVKACADLGSFSTNQSAAKT